MNEAIIQDGHIMEVFRSKTVKKKQDQKTLSPETIDVIREAIQVYRDVYADHVLKAKEEIGKAQQEFNAVYGGGE